MTLERFALADPLLVEGFLTLNRMDILGSHQPSLLVTNHFAAEIWGWQNKDRYHKAVRANYLLETSITDFEEMETFVRLSAGSRLSTVERSAISLALHRGHMLVIDYNNALAKSLNDAGINFDKLVVCHPREVISNLVRSAKLDEETAEKMCQAWSGGRKGRQSARELPKILS